MKIGRRDFLLSATAGLAVSRGSAVRAAQSLIKSKAAPSRTGNKLRLIGVEQHYSIPEVVDAFRCATHTLTSNLDLTDPYDMPSADLPRIIAELVDMETERLADMDRTGVSMQVLSLTAPGVQEFDADTAVELARLANDRAADAVKRHPDRFAALCAFAPQDPRRAVAEMERGTKALHCSGFIVNSHTNNEYLDLPKFWPILEAAEALDGAMYIHPRSPADTMARPMADYGMGGALWGYGVEVGTHAVRLMMSGVLDRFPKIKIVLGHMGEALPFWLARLDSIASPGEGNALNNQLKPSEYFRRNFWIATTGVLDHLALRFCIDKIGADRILWATDYPYQSAAPAVSFLDTAPISDADRQMIAHGNAERLFHLSTQSTKSSQS